MGGEVMGYRQRGLVCCPGVFEAIFRMAGLMVLLWTRLMLVLRLKRFALAIFTLLLIFPNAASAACTVLNVPDSHTSPSASPMASGGAITITLGTLCDSFGLNPYPDTTGANHSTPPQHGTVTVNPSPGIITYTNNGDGATSDSFILTDASDKPFTVNVAIAAATSPITITPGSAAAPNVGASYSQALGATGGNPPYTFAQTGGSLPPGLSFSGNTISGTPDQAGAYSVTFTVTDNGGVTGTKSYPLTVPVPTITIAPLANANLNTPYNQALSASGALAPYSFSLYSSDTLPAGLSLNNGVISGTPTALGTHNFRIEAVDSSPNRLGPQRGPYRNVISLSINVQNVPPTANPVSATVSYGSAANPIPLNITGAPAISVAVATAASHGTATASGTSITYTPTAGYAGPDSFAYTATNGAGTSSPATVSITVSSPAITYAPGNPPAGTQGVAYSQSIAGASGGTGPYTYTLFSGTLPGSIILNPNGTLSGTATAAGTFPIKVVAKDSSSGPAAPFASAPADIILTINAAPPTLASVAPANGPDAGGTSVTLTGSGFTGTTAVTFGGTAATSFTVNSNTSITATTPAHAAGTVAVAITAPGGNATLPGAFTYDLPVPTLTSVAPSNGPDAGGTSVTLSGSGFMGTTAVTFGGTAATSFTVNSDTSITAITPAHAAGSVAVAVTAPGGSATLPGAFTYDLPVPTLTSVAPSNGPDAGGTSVTLSGSGFTGTTGVTFGGTAATSFTVNSDTSITATTPAHAAGAVAVAITAPGGSATLPGAFTFELPVPTLTSVSPSNGPDAGGTSVTLSGSGFTGTTVVTFGGTAATSFTVNSDSSITATTPAHAAGAVAVAITAPGGSATLPGAFTFELPVPTLTSVSPSNGPDAGGTSVTLSGSGFTGTTAVTFGGTAATSFTVNSDSSITATTPAHAAGTVAVAITAPGGNATLPGAFTYDLPVPTLTSVAPSNGPDAGGTSVTLSGSGFIGATAVTFGGTAATSFTVNSDTSITAATPAHAAGVVAVAITAPGGNAALPGAFTYDLPVPTLTSVAPSNGPDAGGTSVTLSGSGFTGTTAVTFGGTAATSFTVNSDTSITATTPAHAAGSVAVAVTAPGGSVTLPGAFTYDLPVPTLASLSPSNGPVSGGTSVTLTGSGFTGTTAVTFGGTAATSFTVGSDTSITATTPAHVAGAVAVAITTPGGSATLPSAFIYDLPVPMLTSLSPSNGPDAGGTSVTLTGSGFTGTTAVTFGGTAATSFTVNSDSSITATTPAHAAGAVAVAVIAPGGNATLPGAFTYSARPDPSRDPEVIGMLEAQYQSTQRFAKTQITNFRDRLEQLHNNGGGQTSSWNLQVSSRQSSADALGYAQESKAQDSVGETLGLTPARPSERPGERSSQAAGTPSDVAVWAGGYVNFGSADKGDTNLNHTLVGVSGGVDYRFSADFTAGVGVGYGRDAVNIGSNGTETNGRALSAALYGSYHPKENIFIDGLLGYSALDFGSRRFVTSGGGFASGERNGSQVFGSVSIGYEHRQDVWLLSPYGRLEAAWSQLDAFTEDGAGSENLTFGRQSMDMLAGVIGLRGQYTVPQDWGGLTAKGRIELTHDFQGSSRASMGYATLGNGLPYSLKMEGFTKDYVSIGLGLDASLGDDTTVGFDYTTGLGFEGRTQEHNFGLLFNMRF